MRLTEEEMIKIMNDKTINLCSQEQKNQIYEFAFGPLYVVDEEKGKMVEYYEYK